MTRAGALLAELRSDVGHKMHSRLDALGKAVSKDPKAVEAALRAFQTLCNELEEQAVRTTKQLSKLQAQEPITKVIHAWS